MKKTNRNYKDSVFVDLFAKDISAKENFVSLYNAIHETNLDYHTTEVQPVMIEQVLYKKFYNDNRSGTDARLKHSQEFLKKILGDSKITGRNFTICGTSVYGEREYAT